jgi:2-C-methyl-D-erythritol 2,4-cyclodiphosphate synthase
VTAARECSKQLLQRLALLLWLVVVPGQSSFSDALASPHSYEIGNMDATIIAQKPKLSPHKAAIKASLCNIMGIHESALNIKAKTHEKVDSLGEERSIACHTVVLLVRK